MSTRRDTGIVRPTSRTTLTAIQEFGAADVGTLDSMAGQARHSGAWRATPRTSDHIAPWPQPAHGKSLAAPTPVPGPAAPDPARPDPALNPRDRDRASGPQAATRGPGVEQLRLVVVRRSRRAPRRRPGSERASGRSASAWGTLSVLRPPRVADVKSLSSRRVRFRSRTGIVLAVRARLAVPAMLRHHVDVH